MMLTGEALGPLGLPLFKVHTMVVFLFDFGKNTMEKTGKSTGSVLLHRSVLTNTPHWSMHLRSSALLIGVPGRSIDMGMAGLRPHKNSSMFMAEA